MPPLYRYIKQDQLLLVILAFSTCLFLVVAGLHIHYGAGPELHQMAWYVPMMYGFAALIALCVSFLAFGRTRVYANSHSFWIGIGFLVMSTASVFLTLTWPGLMPLGQAVLDTLPSTASWFVMLQFFVLGVCLLLAVSLQWPERVYHWHELLLVALAVILLTVVSCAVVIQFESSLPVLVAPDGTYLRLRDGLSVGFIVLFAAGAVLSVYQYRQHNFRLLGYVALIQVTLVFFAITALLGNGRYDLWHYTGLVLLVGGFGVMLAGLLAEYIDLLKTESRHNEMLLQADQDKNDFLAVLSHELRNPLATTMLSLELLRSEQSEDNETVELIKNAEDHAVMMQRLLDDILDTIRLTRGQFTLHKEAVDLTEIVGQSVASVEDFARQYRHTLTVTPLEEPLILYVDPIRIKQVLVNILTNACKYTEPGGAITLAVIKRSGEVCIRVSDTGIGIREEDRQYIFEPYRQIRSKPKRGTGLGIGLYITKQLVEMHGGRITVKNRDDGLQGSVFNIYLPYQPDIAIAANTVIEPVVSVVKGAHVLVADDNESTADLLAELLRAHDVHAATAYSGAAALAYMREHQPDLVLLDIDMPSMGGFEIIAEAQRMQFPGALAAFTGHGQEIDRQKIREAGFAYHLVKPVSVADVLSVLAAIKINPPVDAGTAL